jgi:hypothetical protein
MKTLTLMLVSGFAYAGISNELAKAFANSPMHPDALFALFVIGVIGGVFFSRRLGWID